MPLIALGQTLAGFEGAGVDCVRAPIAVRSKPEGIVGYRPNNLKVDLRRNVSLVGQQAEVAKSLLTASRSKRLRGLEVTSEVSYVAAG